MNRYNLKSRIAFIIFGCLVNVAIFLLNHMLNGPFIDNQLGSVIAAYYYGPLYGAIMVLLTGGFCGLISKTAFIYIVPELVCVLLIGYMARDEKFIDSFLGTVHVLSLVGILEGIALALMQFIFLKGAGDHHYGTAILRMMLSANYPTPVRFLIEGIFLAFQDLTCVLLFMWIVHYLEHPLQKKKERRKYLNRNLKKGSKKILVGAVLFTSLLTLGVDTIPTKAADSVSYVQQVYNSKNGLMGGASNDIVQTQDGTIWVATYGGLYRYNGIKFDLVTEIPSVRSVRCLYLDSDQNLWIGNNDAGVVVATPEHNWYTLTTDDGLPSNSIHGIVQSGDGVYYVATSAGTALVYFNGEDLTCMKKLPEIAYTRNLAVNSRGQIALIDNAQVVYLVHSGVIIDEIPLGDYNASSVQFDEEDRLYVGTTESEILVYDYNKDGYVFDCELLTGDLSGINELYFQESGVTYVAAESGIGYFDSNDNFSKIYVDDYDNSAENIMEDYQGNIWFTSTTCGLLSLTKSYFTDVFSNCGVSGDVTNAVMEWNGLLYVGCDSGLRILDLAAGKSIENELTENLSGHRVRCVRVDSKNSLWIAAYDVGVYEITDSGEVYRYNSENGSFGNNARLTKELSSGIVAISGDTGLSYVKDHEIISNFSLGDGLANAFILSVAETDDGKVLAGSDGDGIFIIDGNEIVKDVTTKDGLTSGVILRMVPDPYTDGTFVLTGGGLCYMNADYSCHEISGFPYYDNLDMIFDEDGTAYVYSSAGIYVTTYDSLMSGGEVDTNLLDTNDGLLSFPTGNAWNYLSDDNILYISCSNGLYSLNLSDYNKVVDVYKPKISSIVCDGEAVSYANQTSIAIPAGIEEVTLTMDLNNNTTSDPTVVYYLSGVDESRHTCLGSELSTVTYSHIPYGTYDFYIEVLSEDGETVLSKTSYTIEKDIEEYETVGFRIYFYCTLIELLLSLMIAIANFATQQNAKRQRAEYSKTLTRLEREKAEALEQALHQEEHASQSKSDFLASMSHEIRTPINAILGMNTMIMRETKQDEIKRYASDLESAGKTLLALINDILDFSKIESGKMELVLGDYDLGSIVNDLVNMVRPKTDAKGLELKLQVNPDIPAYLYGDEVRIKQIILNILNNAVKYTESGSVTLAMDYEKLSEGEIALKISVADTGIGIKEEDLKKLFSPYERIEEGRNKKIEGTGLGMSITKTLLELMNSQLVVQSTYGVGSTFSCSIVQQIRSVDCIGDINSTMITRDNQVDDVEAFHAPDAKILVVDDVEMNLLVAENLLKRVQIQVETATSGAQAIEKAKECKYDIIFLDSMMPEMSGEETLRIMKRDCTANEDTPMIVLTANAIKGAREEYLNAGFDNYLSKPIDSAKLEAMLQCYLPEDKVILVDAAERTAATEEVEEDDSILDRLNRIPGIDVEEGIKVADGEDIYLVVCKNFYDTAPGRIEMLEEYYSKQDIRNYTIQVHALKSSARLIGAYSLSEQAWNLEQAGRADDLEEISAKTEGLIADYRSLLQELDSVYGDTSEEDSRELIDTDTLRGNLRDLRELVEAFDMDTAAMLLDSLEEYRMPDDFAESYKKIKAYMAEVERDSILSLLDNYLKEE